MLPKYYRFRILWEADQTLTYDNGARVNLRFLPWKIASDALVYGTVITEGAVFLDTGGTIADDGQVEGGVNNNTSDLYWGGQGFFEVIADQNGTDGTMRLYVEESDDNSNWPSDGADFDIGDLKLVLLLDMSTDAEDEDRSKNFHYGSYI